MSTPPKRIICYGQPFVGSQKMVPWESMFLFRIFFVFFARKLSNTWTDASKNQLKIMLQIYIKCRASYVTQTGSAYSGLVTQGEVFVNRTETVT